MIEVMGMILNNVDEFVKEILNDRRIFFYSHGAELFNKAEMDNLKKKYENNKADFIKEIKDKIEQVNEEIEHLKEQKNNRLKKRIENRQRCVKLAESMIRAVTDTPNSLEELLETFDDLGILSSNLAPRHLEDIGQLIEETEKNIVKEFILYKAQKEGDKRKREALMVLWNYVDQLYGMNLSLSEKGFVIRKINAFKLLPEVINHE